MIFFIIFFCIHLMLFTNAIFTAFVCLLNGFCSRSNRWGQITYIVLIHSVETGSGFIVLSWKLISPSGDCFLMLVTMYLPFFVKLHDVSIGCRTTKSRVLTFHFFMWAIFKVFIKFVTILLLFYCFTFCFFGHKTCEILAPQPEMEPTSPAWEGEALTTGPPGKSLNSVLSQILFFFGSFELLILYWGIAFQQCCEFHVNSEGWVKFFQLTLGLLYHGQELLFSDQCKNKCLLSARICPTSGLVQLSEEAGAPPPTINEEKK